MEQSKLTQLSQAISEIQNQLKSVRRRYPRFLRKEIVAFAQQRRAEGWSCARTARALGLSGGTLTNWMKPEQRGFRPVRMHARNFEQSRGILLVTPEGHRVEGLELEEIVKVLKALA